MIAGRLRPGLDLVVGPTPRAVRRVTTSRTEILHLAIAFVVLTVDIALVQAQITLRTGPGSIDIPTLVAGLGVAAVAALTGFVAHEMAHKVVAQRHGFWAEFRMSPAGLFFSLATALFGFLFALPGATVIGGMGDTREWGRTSVAGPMTNLAFGGAFLVAGLIGGRLGLAAPAWNILVFLAFVNAVFAAFNLLPFGPLDGRKVLRWSRSAWVASFGSALLFAGAVVSVLLFATPTL